MNKIETKELINYNGGASAITGTLISAVTKAASTILDIGRSLGTAIRRIVSGNIC